MRTNHAEHLSAIRQHIPESITSTMLYEAQRHFLYFGYARVPYLVSDGVKQAVREEVIALIESAGVRRDLRFKETGDTPRRMRNVRQEQIARSNGLIPRLYSLAQIRTVLSVIAGEEVLECPYTPERYLITRLEQGGDTHGWHWDDYRYALVWVIESPPVHHGGYVQCVPGTIWDKQDPRIDDAIVNNPIYSIGLEPGDIYFMRTDTTLHRVTPLSQGRRTIINMGYACDADLAKQISHETMDGLWSEEGLEVSR